MVHSSLRGEQPLRIKIKRHVKAVATIWRKLKVKVQMILRWKGKKKGERAKDCV